MFGILREKEAPIDVSKFRIVFYPDTIKILLKEVIESEGKVEEKFSDVGVFGIKNGVWLYCLSKDGKWIEKEYDGNWVEEGFDNVKDFLEKDLVCFYTVVNDKCNVVVFRYILDFEGINISRVKYGSYHKELRAYLGSKFVIIGKSVVSGMCPFIEMYAQMKDIDYECVYVRQGEELKLYAWTENELLSKDVCLDEDSEYIDKGFVLNNIDNKLKVMYGGVVEVDVKVDYGKRARFFVDKAGVYYVYWTDISDGWFVGVPTRRLALFPDMLVIVAV